MRCSTKIRQSARAQVTNVLQLVSFIRLPSLNLARYTCNRSIEMENVYIRFKSAWASPSNNGILYGAIVGGFGKPN